MKRRTASKRTPRGRRRRRPPAVPTPVDVVGVEEVLAHPEASPRLSGGDVDADWERAWDSGEEGVGGSVATPDQDVVDEIGEALGVPREPDEEVRASAEILEERDRERWRLEEEAERPRRRRRE